MDIQIRFFSTMTLALLTLLFMQSCKSSPEKNIERGEPILVVEGIQYDEGSQSFSLTLRVDSTGDAAITYYLYDGDSLIMQNTDGYFTGISPLEEGYNVRAHVEWNDTTIVIPSIRVLGFVIQQETIEKLSDKEIQNLINTRDNEVLERHLAQQVELTILDSQIKPSLMHDVLLQLENKVWDSVTVSDVKFDKNNLITAITLKPVEHVEPISDDDEEMVIDEY